VELGLVQPEPPPPPPPPPAPPPLPRHLLADSVVCAAADALKLVPESVRLSVHASFRRARELHMTVEDVEQAMVLALGLETEKRKEKDRTKKKGAQKEG